MCKKIDMAIYYNIYFRDSRFPAVYHVAYHIGKSLPVPTLNLVYISSVTRKYIYALYFRVFNFSVSSQSARTHLNFILHFDVLAATSVFGNLPIPFK